MKERGEGQITTFGKKNPQVHLIIIREWHKNNPSPILRNLDNFPPGAFIPPPPLPPPTIRHKRVNNNIILILLEEHYLPKGVIKNCNIIINERKFYDQPIDSNIKQYVEIRKLTTGQGQDYTSGCLLDYEYIKNSYRLIAIGLSSQKE